jgi:hypothetical protein
LPIIWERNFSRQYKTLPSTRHSKRETKRSDVSDLESRFGGNQSNPLRESGIPNHLFRFATRVFGMTGSWGKRVAIPQFICYFLAAALKVKTMRVNLTK